MPTTENLADLLLEHPFPDGQDLLCTIDSTMGAGEAKSRVRELASQLEASGVRAGEGIAVQLPSGPDLVVAMGAIWLAGAVFVPLNDRAPAAEVQHLLEAIRPAGLLDGRGLTRLESPLRHDPEVAFVTWTSGTTGPPKAILQTHGGYLELLDRVLRPLRGGAAAPTGRRARADTESRARLRRSECRHLQRVLRAEGRSSTGLAATLRHG